MYINITRRVNRYGMLVTNIHLRSNRLAAEICINLKFLIQNDCNSLTSYSIAGCRPNEIRNRSSSARALSSTERSIRSVFGTSSYHLNMLTVITQKEATCKNVSKQFTTAMTNMKGILGTDSNQL